MSFTETIVLLLLKCFPKPCKQCEQLGINFSEMATMAPVQIPFMPHDMGDTQTAKDASSKNLLTGCPYDSYWVCNLLQPLTIVSFFVCLFR